MPRRRLLSYYGALALCVALFVPMTLVLARSAEPQSDVAGPYHVDAGQMCLGPRFGLEQSGEFVTLRRPDDSPAGQLRLKSSRLTGGVKCLDGNSRLLTASVTDGHVTGSVAGRPLQAASSGDSPGPGAQRPRAPDSVSGIYRIVPASDCLGGQIVLAGPDKAVRVTSGEHPLGQLRYVPTGQLSGRVACRDGGTAGVSGSAVDREVQLTLTAAGAHAPSPERATAQKQRSLDSTLAAFFLAVVVVVVFARLGGALMVRIRQPRVMGEVIAGNPPRPDGARRPAPGRPARRYSRPTSSRTSGSRRTSA